MIENYGELMLGLVVLFGIIVFGWAALWEPKEEKNA